MENHKLAQVQIALQRLDQALVRLERAAVQAGTKAEGAAAQAAAAVTEQKNLEAKLDGLTRTHATLKETSSRVAGRLDAAINRLSAALQD
jgi:hypothetical protein